MRVERELMRGAGPVAVLKLLESGEKYGYELVDTLAQHYLIHDRDLVLKTVLDRERAASTGIGKGLAVPHGKCGGCTDLVMAIGKPAQPIDFNSKDGEPVSVVALLASPVDKTGPSAPGLARQVAQNAETDSNGAGAV